MIRALTVAWLVLCGVGEFVSSRERLDSPDAGPAVVLMSASLPMPLRPVAHHYWFLIRGQDETRWERWELWQTADTGRSHWGHVQRDLMPANAGVGGGDPVVHAVWRGDEAERFTRCLRERAPEYEHREAYRAWPGPNSNTFVESMLRGCGLAASLGGTAIGKDYRGLVGASTTSEGTGVQVETPLAGLRVGLREGIEVHALGLSLGVDLWPPAILHPFGDGRLGFGD